MDDPVTVALFGLSGFGEEFFLKRVLLNQKYEDKFKFVAGITPEPEKCGLLGEIEAKNVPVFKFPEEFYAALLDNIKQQGDNNG